MARIVFLFLAVLAGCQASRLDEDHALLGLFDSDVSMEDPDELNLQDFFTIRSSDAIAERANRSQAKSYVKEKTEVYYQMDARDAMTKLTTVGELLILAYSGAKGYPSSTPILTVMMGYQDLVKESLVVTGAFVEITLKALKYHKYAARFANKPWKESRIARSLKFLKKCATLAGRMADESKVLIEETEKLKDLASKALTTANDDSTMATDEKDSIKKMINEEKAEQARQKEIKENLQKRIAEEQKKMRENAALAEENEKGMIVRIPSPPPDPRCIDKEGNYPNANNRNNCKDYSTCTNGVYADQTCTGNTYFKLASKDCDLGLPPRCRDPRCVGKEGNYPNADNRNNCKDYYTCTNGVYSEKTCTRSAYFQLGSKLCNLGLPKRCATCYNRRDSWKGSNKCYHQIKTGSTCTDYLDWGDCDKECNLCECTTGIGAVGGHCSGNGKCMASCGDKVCTGAICRCNTGWIGDKCQINEDANKKRNVKEACSTTNGITKQHCSGHGTCDVTCTAISCTGLTCKCNSGWIGDKCEINKAEDLKQKKDIQQQRAEAEAQRKKKKEEEAEAQRKAKIARNKEEIARQERVKLQYQEIWNNANLTATVTRLMLVSQKADTINMAVIGLQITVKVMGNVRTIFANTWTFWKGVKRHMDDLSASHQELVDVSDNADLHEDFVEEIANSGYSWLTVGKICRMSNLAIREANAVMDKTMRNIPNHAEAKKLIGTLGAKILKGIEDDNANSLNEIASAKNQPPASKPMTNNGASWWNHSI